MSMVHDFFAGFEAELEDLHTKYQNLHDQTQAKTAAHVLLLSCSVYLLVFCHSRHPKDLFFPWRRWKRSPDEWISVWPGRMKSIMKVWKTDRESMEETIKAYEEQRKAQGLSGVGFWWT